MLVEAPITGAVAIATRYSKGEVSKPVATKAAVSRRVVMGASCKSHTWELERGIVAAL